MKLKCFVLAAAVPLACTASAFAAGDLSRANPEKIVIEM